MEFIFNSNAFLVNLSSIAAKMAVAIATTEGGWFSVLLSAFKFECNEQNPIVETSLRNSRTWEM